MIERIGPMKCDVCGREWVAAMEFVETEHLECPDCGCMVQVPPQNNEESAATATQQANAENTACKSVESLCEICGGRIVQCADEQRCERCGELFRLL